MLRIFNFKFHASKRNRGAAALITIVLVGSVIMDIAIVGLFVIFFLSQSTFGAQASAEALSASRAGIQDAMIKIVRGTGSVSYILPVCTRTAQVAICNGFAASTTAPGGCGSAQLPTFGNTYKYALLSLGSAGTKLRELDAVLSVDQTTGQVQVESIEEVAASISAPSPPPPPDTTPPSPPTNLAAAVISSSQINLSWTASTDNVGVAVYYIYRCQGTGCTPGVTPVGTSGANSYQDTGGLSASTAYTYAVSAYDAAGNISAQSTLASGTTASAAIALVQASSTIGPNSTATNIAFPGNNTAGDMIIVSMRVATTMNTYRVGDTNGNTYTTSTNFTTSTPATRSITWYALNIAGGANTVTVTSSGNTAKHVIISEFSGVAASGAADVVTTSTDKGAKGTALSSGSATTNFDGELIYGFGLADGSINMNWTAGAGFAIGNKATTTRAATEWMVQPAAGAISAPLTMSSSDNWMMEMSTFKPGP